MTDRRLLAAAAFLRALATGMVGILLGVFLAELGLDAAHIGLIVTLGLASGAVATLVVTFAGDRLGRRRVLVVLALLGAVGGIALACVSSAGAAAAAACLGMVNGMGRDRSAALALEQALLPATTADAGRTRAFAWYNVVQDGGLALGGLLAGTPALLHHAAGVDKIMAYRLVLVGYALLVGATAVLYLCLSPMMEVREAQRAPVSPDTRRVLWRISALFGMDSLGGGFLTSALLSYFFFERFGVGAGTLGPLFFGARVLNALSHFGAAWLAGRIGLVNTMVLTHLPSSVLLGTIAWAPTFPVAATLFLVREGLVEMDVPTRQSYVMAVVRPEERTVASGVTNLVRTGGWAIAPSLAGVLMQGASLGTPLVVGAALKIGYDALLYAAFRRIRAPEERAQTP